MNTKLTLIVHYLKKLWSASYLPGHFHQLLIFWINPFKDVTAHSICLFLSYLIYTSYSWFDEIQFSKKWDLWHSHMLFWTQMCHWCPLHLSNIFKYDKNKLWIFFYFYAGWFVLTPNYIIKCKCRKTNVYSFTWLLALYLGDNILHCFPDHKNSSLHLKILALREDLKATLIAILLFLINILSHESFLING
jgi:hypothetical protein